ncbi:hypothetical protein ACHAPJ_009949 [Fusarium lateritium]
MADLKEYNDKPTGLTSAEPNTKGPSKSEGIHTMPEILANGLTQLNLETNKMAPQEQAAQEDFHTLQQEVQAIEQENKHLEQEVQTLVEACQLYEESARIHEDHIEMQQIFERETKIHEESERENRAIQMKIEAMENLLATSKVLNEPSGLGWADEHAVCRILDVFYDVYEESPALPDEKCAVLARFTTRMMDTIILDAQEKTNDA